MEDQVARYLLHRATLLQPFSDQFKHSRDVSRCRRLAKAKEEFLIRRAEESHHVIVGDLMAGEGDQLVKERDRVTHRPFGRAGDKVERLLIDLKLFDLRA